MLAAFSTFAQPYIHTPFPNLPPWTRRIPPGQDIKVLVHLIGTMELANASVSFSVESSSGAQGWATVDTPEVRLNYQGVLTVNVKLTPLKQTLPRQPVCLVARGPRRGVDECKSNPFHICAYPVAIETTPLRLGHVKSDDRTPDGTNSAYGLKVENKCVSESGQFRDLDQVEVSELVEYKKNAGSLTQAVAHNSSYRPATADAPDFHCSIKGKMMMVRRGTESQIVAVTLMEGYSEAHQLFVFTCKRSGVEGVVVPNSGFIVKKKASIVEPAAGDAQGTPKLSFTVEEIGSDVIVKTKTAKAGRVVPTERFAKAYKEHLLEPPPREALSPAAKVEVVRLST